MYNTIKLTSGILADDVKATAVAGRRTTQLPQRKVTATAAKTGSTVTQSHLNTNRLSAAESHRQNDDEYCKTQ